MLSLQMISYGTEITVWGPSVKHVSKLELDSEVSSVHGGKPQSEHSFKHDNQMQIMEHDVEDTNPDETDRPNQNYEFLGQDDENLLEERGNLPEEKPQSTSKTPEKPTNDPTDVEEVTSKSQEPQKLMIKPPGSASHSQRVQSQEPQGSKTPKATISQNEKGKIKKLDASSKAGISDEQTPKKGDSEPIDSQKTKTPQVKDQKATDRSNSESKVAKTPSKDAKNQPAQSKQQVKHLPLKLTDLQETGSLDPVKQKLNLKNSGMSPQKTWGDSPENFLSTGPTPQQDSERSLTWRKHIGSMKNVPKLHLPSTTSGEGLTISQRAWGSMSDKPTTKSEEGKIQLSQTESNRFIPKPNERFTSLDNLESHPKAVDSKDNNQLQPEQQKKLTTTPNIQETAASSSQKGQLSRNKSADPAKSKNLSNKAKPSTPRLEKGKSNISEGKGRPNELEKDDIPKGKAENDQGTIQKFGLKFEPHSIAKTPKADHNKRGSSESRSNQSKAFSKSDIEKKQEEDLKGKSQNSLKSLITEKGGASTRKDMRPSPSNKSIDTLSDHKIMSRRGSMPEKQELAKPQQTVFYLSQKNSEAIESKGPEESKAVQAEGNKDDKKSGKGGHKKALTGVEFVNQDSNRKETPVDPMDRRKSSGKIRSKDISSAMSEPTNVPSHRTSRDQNIFYIEEPKKSKYNPLENKRIDTATRNKSNEGLPHAKTNLTIDPTSNEPKTESYRSPIAEALKFVPYSHPKSRQDSSRNEKSTGEHPKTPSKSEKRNDSKEGKKDSGTPKYSLMQPSRNISRVDNSKSDIPQKELSDQSAALTETIANLSKTPSKNDGKDRSSQQPSFKDPMSLIMQNQRRSSEKDPNLSSIHSSRELKATHHPVHSAFLKTPKDPRERSNNVTQGDSHVSDETSKRSFATSKKSIKTPSEKTSYSKDMEGVGGKNLVKSLFGKSSEDIEGHPKARSNSKNLFIEPPEKITEEDDNEDDNVDLKKYTDFLKKGHWDYFNSPVVHEMQMKQAEKEAARMNSPGRDKYYPVHVPCSQEDEEKPISLKISYSPKMYQAVFGDMTQNLKQSQTSPQNPSDYHHHPKEHRRALSFSTGTPIKLDSVSSTKKNYFLSPKQQTEKKTSTEVIA